MDSIWSQTCHIEERAPLRRDMKTEIAVIGGGIAGILTASALQRAGCRVVVLEAGRIAGGQTRNTTAKITSQHGMIYQELIKTLGKDKAGQYAMANEAAIAEYRRIIEDEAIACEWEERDAYVYGDNADRLRAEAEAAASLGLPASFVCGTRLPFPAAGAVRFTHQAQFHPLKFLKHMAEPLTIYENTPVLRVEEDSLQTADATVRAERIVFACHYPFVNFPGLYFARMHQERSYVLALENAAQVDGMWIGDQPGGYSFRNRGSLLLLGGGGHRCGDNSAGGRYELLRQKAGEWFPGSREVAHWSAQDCITADGVPYIGRYADSRPNWYVATGFQKWGMTSAMVSALLLRDMICHDKSPWAEVFDPGRLNAATLTGTAEEGGQAVKGLARQLFQIPAERAAELPAGHGGVVFLNGEKLGVYKDEAGRVYPVDIRCPHMGCQLEWNPDERSWDCPCHGSRFDRFGHLISGPAQEGLVHG
ncbi:MAG: FAD-dependent oxidoreductase [Oscillospiraceae bacterium]|nr:FAD-dependent oxidoreductase [Oscillospiraceae bacterium]